MADLVAGVDLRLRFNNAQLEWSHDNGATWSAVGASAFPYSGAPGIGSAGSIVPSLSPAGTITWAGDSMMSGNMSGDGKTRDARFSPGYYLFGGFDSGTIPNTSGGFISTQLARQGRATPTVNITAISGKKVADMITAGAVNGNFTAWMLAQPDGSDVFANYGVNDIAVAGDSPATVAANLAIVVAAFFAARPNSRLHWLPIMFYGSETAVLGSDGRAQGTGANDTAIRQANVLYAALFANYPRARFYGQLYYDLYADKYINGRTITQDNIHWTQWGAQMAARSLFRQMSAPGGLFSSLVEARSESDYTPGDWYEEVRQFALYQSGQIPLSGSAAVLNFNRSRKIDATMFPIGALPAGAADAGIAGGGLVCNPTNFTQLSPIVQLTPKATPWCVAFRVSFNANSAGRSAFFGFGDANVTGAGAGDGIWIGYDNAVSSTKFIAKIRHAGTSSNVNLGAGSPWSYNPNVDTNEHTIVMFFDGNLATAYSGLWTLWMDGQLAVCQQPGANFPTTSQFLQAGPCAGGGTVTFKQAAIFYNETLP